MQSVKVEVISLLMSLCHMYVCDIAGKDQDNSSVLNLSKDKRLNSNTEGT